MKSETMPLSGEDIKALGETKMDVRHDHLNAELESKMTKSPIRSLDADGANRQALGSLQRIQSDKSYLIISTVKEIRKLFNSFVYWDEENAPRIGYRWMDNENIADRLAMPIPDYYEVLNAINEPQETNNCIAICKTTGLPCTRKSRPGSYQLCRIHSKLVK